MKLLSWPISQQTSDAAGVTLTGFAVARSLGAEGAVVMLFPDAHSLGEWERENKVTLSREAVRGARLFVPKNKE